MVEITKLVLCNRYYGVSIQNESDNKRSDTIMSKNIDDVFEMLKFSIIPAFHGYMFCSALQCSKWW